MAITGIGAISAAGADAAALTAALASGRDGLACLALADLPLAASLPVAAVRGMLPAGPRNAALALMAGREALRSAGLIQVPAQISALGLAVGSCTGGMRESEAIYLREGADSTSAVFRDQPVACLADRVARTLGLRGPCVSHAEACASSACALAEAMEWVRCGLVPAVLVVGSDALTRLTLAGFASLQVVDPAGCRPFTEERAGMSLGEGACAVVIEDAHHARQRGARPRAALLGWGLTADAHHATAPHPSGQGLEQAIRAALADSEVPVNSLGFVAAHGTGTRDNDACEATTLARIFGAIPTASTKRSTGHTMGASAAFSLFAAIQAVESQELFPSAGALLGTPLGGIEVLRSRRAANIDTALITSLAFGGVNAALVVGRAERCG